MPMDWFDAVPKVELHVHLEGAIPYHALWTLMEKYGGDPDVPDYGHLIDKFTYKDFPHFIDTWIWKNRYLRTYDDFTFLSEQVALDLARQNIRYAEIFYSPADFQFHGLSTQTLTEAIRTGLSKVPDINIGLIADLVRDHGPQKAERTLLEVNEVKDMGIIGVGLGGSEQLFPPGLFSDVFRFAKDLGFRVTIHAGEVAGPEGIWDAIHFCQPDRLGHGTRAREDHKLIKYLRANQIPLEICPISNLRTGTVKSIQHHPVRSYYEHGLMITINTDDPKMFGNSLAQEYLLLVNHLGFNRNDIRRLILQAIQSSWLPESKKNLLMIEFKKHPAWCED